MAVTDNEVDEAAEQLAALGLPVNKEAPEIPWRHSKAKALLRQDILDNVVPKWLDASMPTDVIFTSRPEYVEYSYAYLSSHLSSLRRTVKKDSSRAKEDLKRFRIYQEGHPAHNHSAHGYPEWEV